MTPARSRAPSSTRLGRVELLLENMDGKIDTIIETMAANRDEAKRDNAELYAKLDVRIRALEEVVRQSSATLKQHSFMLEEHSVAILTLGRELREVRTSIAKIAEDVAAIRAELPRFATKEELLALEARVSKLEKEVQSSS